MGGYYNCYCGGAYTPYYGGTGGNGSGNADGSGAQGGSGTDGTGGGGGGGAPTAVTATTTTSSSVTGEGGDNGSAGANTGGGGGGGGAGMVVSGTGGTGITLTNSGGTITGGSGGNGGSDTAAPGGGGGGGAGVFVTGSGVTVTNSSGGTIIGGAGGAGGINSGVMYAGFGAGGDGGDGIVVNGTDVTINNSGTIIGGAGGAGGNTWLSGNVGAGISVNGSAGGLTNSGTITGGVYNNSTGTIDVLTNGGAISGSYAGIYNSGSITTLINSGLSSGNVGGAISGGVGIENAAGTIGTLTNYGSISSSASGSGTGIYNAGTIGTLTNNGSISGASTGIGNDGTIGTLSNSGSISGVDTGISNYGTIQTLDNNLGGTISGGPISNGWGDAIGIENGNVGTINGLTNNGTIGGTITGGTGHATGIGNYGTIGTLTNNGTISGTATGTGAIGSGIYNQPALTMTYYSPEPSGTIGTLTNSGLITGSTDGIANGGIITTLNNTAEGTISGPIGINNLSATTTVNGSQTATTGAGLISALNNDGLVTGTTSGIANAGSITTLNNTANGTISGPIGINNLGAPTTTTNSGNATVTNNSGSIGTLTNSGLITGSQYAIYNGASGTIGPITNSGVIAGNIENDSSNDLNISGGTGTIFGTLTGYDSDGTTSTTGTITNTSSNVAFGSGNLVLNDNINVGSNAVNNTGTAVLQVNQPIAITGNYNQSSSATLQIGVASGATTQGAIATDSGYGRLVVSGNATIASGSSVTLQSNGYAFAAGQHYVVMDTAGTAVYNAAALNYSINGYASSVTGTVASNGTNSDLVLDVVSATLIPPSTPTSTPPSTSPSTPTSTPRPTFIVTAPNAVASINGLLNYNVTSNFSLALNTLENAVLGSLSQGTSATANQIGKQLAPTQTDTAAAAPTFDALNVVGAHVDGLRLAQAEGETGVATGEGPEQWGVWGQAYGGHASQGEIGQVDGYSANYGGLLIGADKAVNDNWRVGGVFSYSNTAVNSTGDTAGDTTTINGYGLIGYASYTASQWYVNLSGGVIQQQYDTTRQFSMQGLSGTADGHFSGQQYVARAEAGYPLALGGITLTPLASLTYSYQDQGSYTESGGNGAALSVDASHASSVRSSLGAKLEEGFSTHYGEIVPEVQVQWIHEYDHTAQVTGASYAGDPTGVTAFTTVGATPVSDLADLSLGVTLVRANNMSLTVRYELQAGSGFVSNTGVLRLEQKF
ncbi:autotransporter domain-containing protein [Pararobbsia alpina]|uniref:autotransporter domain-containing protein n=1 Tax=Pararobbsia alpina TaxID=621374 RepID=UPI003CCCD0E7